MRKKIKTRKPEEPSIKVGVMGGDFAQFFGKLLHGAMQGSAIPSEIIEGRFVKVLHDDFMEHLMMVIARMLFTQSDDGKKAFLYLISTWKENHLKNIPNADMPDEHRKVLLGVLDKMEYTLNKMVSDEPGKPSVPDGVVQ